MSEGPTKSRNSELIMSKHPRRCLVIRSHGAGRPKNDNTFTETPLPHNRRAAHPRQSFWQTTHLHPGRLCLRERLDKKKKISDRRPALKWLDTRIRHRPRFGKPGFLLRSSGKLTETTSSASLSSIRCSSDRSTTSWGPPLVVTQLSKVSIAPS